MKYTELLNSFHPTIMVGEDMKTFVTVDEKGRIVLPSELRKNMEIKVHQRMLMERMDDNVLVLKKIESEISSDPFMRSIKKPAKSSTNIDLEKLEEELWTL